MIDFTKPIRTRAGDRVEIIHTNGPEPYPVFARIFEPNESISEESFTREGFCNKNKKLGPYDLLNLGMK